MKNTIPQACKGNIPYVTFLNEDAIEALRIYLKERKALWPYPDNAPFYIGGKGNLTREERNVRPMRKRRWKL
jgi:hypothetical protein